ncbi:hypothetical protein BUZ15_09075 [Staphylococcus gallinarum]|jgi:hypothetical protein|uniref:Uncharacterized protein n=1 Tax=Staphylococcus gallinarum TaxID=1293 RepID=A0A2T4SVU7_STAGA|nr:hypothetical protein [Staphylococcus gallinarum]MCD8821828.1 hypothetical protein [Staphylococcus gallinarum]MCD8827200.1 hypothetical protein [Staphylococcus gallinarum]PTE75707.1 hypothetical protein BUY96_09730 [Staphylococcus gallinarum]PTL09095.1 hypothetical protein BUZ15_09075 [Staphylococcus gallinarum]PTL12399.1 hypothetical protein BUZ09_01055 [Staphylococcus gallinarum]
MKRYDAQFSEMLTIIVPVILVLLSNFIDKSSYHLVLMTLYVIVFGYVVIRKLITTVQAIDNYRHTRQPVFITVKADLWLAFTLYIIFMMCIVGIIYTILFWQWPVNIVVIACIVGVICLLIFITSILGKRSFVFSDNHEQ